MGSVSCGFNREKMRNYCGGSKRQYSEMRQKLKGFGLVNVEMFTQWFGGYQWVLQLHPWAPGQGLRAGPLPQPATLQRYLRAKESS